MAGVSPNILINGGLVCLIISLIFWGGRPFQFMRKPISQIYADSRARKKTHTPVVFKVLMLLGIVLTIWGQWWKWHG
jgi:hypothetical protein